MKSITLFESFAFQFMVTGLPGQNGVTVLLLVEEGSRDVDVTV